MLSPCGARGRRASLVATRIAAVAPHRVARPTDREDRAAGAAPTKPNFHLRSGQEFDSGLWSIDLRHRDEAIPPAGRPGRHPGRPSLSLRTSLGSAAPLSQFRTHRPPSLALLAPAGPPAIGRLVDNFEPDMRHQRGGTRASFTKHESHASRSRAPTRPVSVEHRLRALSPLSPFRPLPRPPGQPRSGAIPPHVGLKVVDSTPARAACRPTCMRRARGGAE